MEDSLSKALVAAGLVCLPKAYTEATKKVWIRAILKVHKVGGHTSYCIAENDGSGKPVIKRDFGPISAITGIESVHPYEELDKRFVPDLRNNEHIRKFLIKADFKESRVDSLMSKEGKTPEQIKEDRMIIRNMIKSVAIKHAIATFAEDERCLKIKENGRKQN